MGDERFFSISRQPKCIPIVASQSVSSLKDALANSIPNEDRILIIEDTAELAIRKPHVVSAEAQLDTHKSTITFDDLLKANLRHRPDRIIVGEVRGAEARTLLDALNTGHRGMLATIHANSANGALQRLANLVLRGVSHQSQSVVEAEIKAGIDFVVHLNREQSHRYVYEILDRSAGNP